MDRVIVYPNALPRALDVLRTNQFAMVGLSKLGEAVFGSASIVADGFTCSPTNPTSLSVLIGPGQVYQAANLELTAISSLKADGTQIVKQGILAAATSLTLAPQLSVGQSACYLIEAQYADDDSQKEVLNFYNAANPSIPLTGIDGTGGKSTIVRSGVVNFAIKPGAATNGIPTPPSPDAGYVGLFVVTLSYGQSAIQAGNIANYAGYPSIPEKLQSIPGGIQANRYVYVKDTGTVNALIVSPYPAITSLVEGLELLVKPNFTNTVGTPTLTVSGITANLLKRDGTALAVGDVAAGVRVRVIYDGAAWRLAGPAFSEILRNIVNSGQVQVVASGIVLWVRTDGSDANDGSANDAGHAFATISAAMSAARKYSAVGGAVTIRLGMQGTYAAPNGAAPPGSNLIIYGDPAVQGNYILSGSGSSGQPLVAAVGCQIALVGLSVSNQGTTNYSVGASGGGGLTLTNVTFYTAQVSNLFHIAAFGGGSVGVNGGVIIASGMGGWALASGGAITFSGAAVTFVNNPTWTDGGVKAIANGNVQLAAPLTINGTAQGPRFSVSLCGAINTNGSGPNVFPGSTVPSTPYPTGGQYA